MPVLSTISRAAHSTIQGARDSCRVRLHFLKDKFKSRKVKTLDYRPCAVLSVILHSPLSTCVSWDSPLELQLLEDTTLTLRGWWTQAWWRFCCTRLPPLVVFGGCFPSFTSVHVVEVKMDDIHCLLHSRGWLVTHYGLCCRDSMLSQTAKIQECYLRMNLGMKKDKLLF